MQNLLDLLEDSARAFGSRRLAVEAPGGRELAYTDLLAQAERVAAALSSRFGVQPGDQVGFLLPNCLEILPIYFGILRAGAVAVPINARLKADELEFILGDSQARALFVGPSTWPAAQAGAAKAGVKNLVGVGFPQPPAGVLPWSEFLSESAPPPPRPNPDPSGTAAIIYTSGTTGRPKGAMLTHANILFNIASTKAGHGFRPEDVHLLAVPLFHVTGLNTLLPTALAQGAGLVITSQIDPEDLLEALEQHACSTFFGVPTTFYLLSALPDLRAERFPALRLVAYSGAPMSAQIIRKLRSIFPSVALHNFYGLTETTSVSTVLPGEQALLRPESIGRPPPGLELRVVDEADRSLPAGAIGELCLRGPSVFQGYYRRPEATAEALRGGWFHTGDTALLDEEGYVFLRGRKKEMVIVAGENVYPIEVENVLCAHVAVQEAAVFGRPDSALGELVHAAVVLRPGAAVTDRELRAFAAERLAAFKVPRTIRILDKLPRNPSGKVMKRDL